MPLEMTMTMPSKMNCSASLSAKPHIAARRRGEESAWQQSLPQKRAKTVSRHVRDLSIIQHVWQKIRSPNPDLEGIRMSALPDHHFKVCLLLAISRSPSIPTICPPLHCNQVTTTILPMYGSHESNRYVAGIVMEYIYSRTHKQTQSMWILTIEYSFECPLTNHRFLRCSVSPSHIYRPSTRLILLSSGVGEPGPDGTRISLCNRSSPIPITIKLQQEVGPLQSQPFMCSPNGQINSMTSQYRLPTFQYGRSCGQVKDPYPQYAWLPIRFNATNILDHCYSGDHHLKYVTGWWLTYPPKNYESQIGS